MSNHANQESSDGRFEELTNAQPPIKNEESNGVVNETIRDDRRICQILRLCFQHHLAVLDPSDSAHVCLQTSESKLAGYRYLNSRIGEGGVHYFRDRSAERQTTIGFLGLQHGFEIISQGRTWIALGHGTSNPQADVVFITQVLETVYGGSLGSIEKIIEVVDRDSVCEWLNWEGE